MMPQEGQRQPLRLVSLGGFVASQIHYAECVHFSHLWGALQSFSKEGFVWFVYRSVTLKQYSSVISGTLSSFLPWKPLSTICVQTLWIVISVVALFQRVLGRSWHRSSARSRGVYFVNEYILPSFCQVITWCP